MLPTGQIKVSIKVCKVIIDVSADKCHGCRYVVVASSISRTPRQVSELQQIPIRLVNAMDDGQSTANEIPVGLHGSDVLYFAQISSSRSYR